ncbi:hypothetical protein ILP97_43205 [Amycolatopsis sp. H6(2020)]|nr:hypothetical protein [Amycolatopsis sp. H6(2020)]
MTASTVHSITDSAYEQTCRLIETELGGRRITTYPAQLDDPSTTGARLARRVDDESTAVA